MISEARRIAPEAVAASATETMSAEVIAEDVSLVRHTPRCKALGWLSFRRKISNASITAYQLGAIK
jgi:hypothetical protein